MHTSTQAADTMEWTIERLRLLRADYAAGCAQLQELERQRNGLRDQLLRLDGAVTVLEEQLARSAQPLADATALHPESA